MGDTFSNNLVLYNYFRSSTSYRARIALHFKGLKFEYKAIHLLKNGGEQHSPEYRKINPAGGVPTLVHGDKVIGQSMAILQYLDDVFPENRLFPTDPYLKAKILDYSEGINCVHSLPNLKVLQFLEKEYGADQAKKEQWIHQWMGQNFEAGEKLLAKSAGQYCFGDQITAADCFLIPQITTAQRFNVPLEKYPIQMKIFENALKLEAFKKGHPFRQVDTPPEMRID